MTDKNYLVTVRALVISLVMMTCTLPLLAQAASNDGVVPRVVNFSGKVADAQGKAVAGVTGITFAIYKDQEGGAAIWMETQNVQPDKNGHYSVRLGAANGQGLPSDLFSSGEARWLGAQPQGQAEQPRTMLMSVPYALKAADAETLGGKPLSAFQLATQPGGTNPEVVKPATTYPLGCTSSTACKASYIPAFATTGGASTAADSIMHQSGSTIDLGGSLSVSAGITATGITAQGMSAVGISADSISTSNTTTSIVGTLTGPNNGFAAIEGQATATGDSGFTFGVLGTSASNQGRAVVGLASGTSAVGVIGENSVSGFGVVGKALGSTGTGVYGTGPDYAFQAVGNATQDRTSGGWAKALLYINTYQAPYTIQRCYNSTLTGAAATTPPCGFVLTEIGEGIFTVDLGFEVDDRFVSATAFNGFAVPVIYPSGNQFQIFWYDVRTQQYAAGEYYWLTVY
jgi:hypothetical protein